MFTRMRQSPRWPGGMTQAFGQISHCTAGSRAPSSFSNAVREKAMAVNGSTPRGPCQVLSAVFGYAPVTRRAKAQISSMACFASGNSGEQAG